MLVNIDREWYYTKDRNFTKYENPFFDTTIHAAIVYKNWKLITGDAGHSGFYKNKTEIPNPYPSVHLFDLESGIFLLFDEVNNYLIEQILARNKSDKQTRPKFE